MVAGSAAEVKGGARVRGADLRDVLERTLRELDEDEKRGPLLRATGIRMRLILRDAGLTLDIAAAEEPGRSLRWSFGGDPEWEPKLELEMDSEVANAFLQGRESLAIAIARRRVRCRGDSRAALFFLPAVKLISEPYRRIVASDYPDLALGS